MLLTQEEVRKMEAMCDDTGGYFLKMCQYLERLVRDGVRNGRFTRQQAEEDLDIALWYAYACNNIGGYPYYWRTTRWMPASEKNARGCGTWYYRYAVALMYCGQPEQALEYHRRGSEEEPGYPWNWLQMGKLLCHFGDKAGALAAVEKGLALVPGDYEFTTLQREIGEGRTLWEMENHYINPGADEELQGMSYQSEEEKQDAIQKLWNIAGICLDPEGLARNQALLELTDWRTDGPRCGGIVRVWGEEVVLWFRMNEAAFSRLDPQWITGLRQWMGKDSFPTVTTHREYRIREYEVGVEGYAVGTFVSPETGEKYINRSSGQPVPKPPFLQG